VESELKWKNLFCHSASKFGCLSVKGLKDGLSLEAFWLL